MGASVGPNHGARSQRQYCHQPSASGRGGKRITSWGRPMDRGRWPLLVVLRGVKITCDEQRDGHRLDEHHEEVSPPCGRLRVEGHAWKLGDVDCRVTPHVYTSLPVKVTFSAVVRRRCGSLSGFVSFVGQSQTETTSSARPTPIGNASG